MRARRGNWADAVAVATIADTPLWRVQSDVVNTSLIDRWLPAPAGRILKTDLFDEAVATGLYPALQERGQVMGMDISSGTVSRACARYPELVDPCWPERYSQVARAETLACRGAGPAQELAPVLP